MEPLVWCVLYGFAIDLATLSLKVLRFTMDLFQHRYYRLNKTFMTLIGQWPYQSKRARQSRVAIIIFCTVSQFIPLMLAILKHLDDWPTLLDGFLSLLFGGFYAVKFVGLMWNSQTTLKLLNRIRTDWQVWAREREVKILHKYVEQGRTLTVAYTATMYSCFFVFMVQPIFSKIVNILWMNGTQPGKFPFPVDYYHLDVQKYYFYIALYSSLCLCVLCIVCIANDIMFITHVQHSCGIFAALGQKLERMGNDTSVEKQVISYELNEKGMIYIASCIDRHNDAIEYANLIESSNTWGFLFIIGFGVVQLNISGLRIFMRKSDADETVKFIIYVCSIMFLLVVYCYLCQLILDHSSNIHFHIYNSQWYRLSLKTQKLLQLMTMRCSVPCQVTAGKILIISLRTVLLTLRTALSYFTFVRSMKIV